MFGYQQHFYALINEYLYDKKAASEGDRTRRFLLPLVFIGGVDHWSKFSVRSYVLNLQTILTDA